MAKTNYTHHVGMDVEHLYIDGIALPSAESLNRGALLKATGALAEARTGGGVFSWKNPADADILIEHVALVVTTKATGACTVDVGTTAVSATTTADNLINGVDVHSATGTFTNDESAGTNGKPRKRLAKDKWVTASQLSGDTTGLKGTYEIYYRVL